jgi:citrate lyase subunit beta/citryl-CoA lyase
VRWELQPLRALLFAPGNEPRKATKVGRLGADACVLDLEDAVAHDQKAVARREVAAIVASYADPSVLMVRVNPADSGLMEDDIAEVVHPNLDAIVIPKVETDTALERAASLIAELEAERRAEPGSIRLLALIETARGLARAEELAHAASPRLLTFVFGLVDFALDVGIELGDHAFEQLLYARSRLVVAARAGGLAAPIDGPHMGLEDLDGAVRHARRSRELGFQGQVTVYPPQVAPVQEAYTAFSDDELRHARRVVDAFEEAEAAGLAAIRVDGQFVDYPVYQRAVRTLRLARSGPI